MSGPVTIPDIAFEGTRLLGWIDDSVGDSLMTIDRITGQVSLLATYSVGPDMADGLGLASPGPGTLFVSAATDLVTVNTASNRIAAQRSRGPTKEPINSLTYVGATLYGSERVNGVTLVAIDPVTAQSRRIGALPPNVDAIEGIPAPPSQMAMSPLAELPVQLVARGRAQPALRIGEHTLMAHELATLSRDVADGQRVRRIIPLAALARFGLSVPVMLVSMSGDTRVVSLGTAGLALTTNRRQQFKLVDTHESFWQIFGPIAEIRSMSH
jgi:hypothetical protein